MQRANEEESQFWTSGSKSQASKAPNEDIEEDLDIAGDANNSPESTIPDRFRALELKLSTTVGITWNMTLAWDF